MTLLAPKHSAARALRLLFAVASVVVACTVLAPSASAGVLVKAADNCGTQNLEQPFLRWLDPAQYTLLPAGTFEDSLPGWSLSGARVESGNEPYYVRSWQPTLPMTVVANLLPLLPGARTPVAFRFMPVGGASWTIDDIYVDPKRRI